MEVFTELCTTDLARTWAGADDIAFGRCGPEDRWKWLGDVYTPACVAHDTAVRDALASGSSRVMAHAKSLPKLPAAVGSYVRGRFQQLTGM